MQINLIRLAVLPIAWLILNYLKFDQIYDRQIYAKLAKLKFKAA